MIIWDSKNKEHIIRIRGKELERIKLSDFLALSTNEQIESDLKIKIDVKTKLSEGYHFYVHIFEKEPLKYVLWLGSIVQEPPVPKGRNYWWETPIEV